MALYLGNLLAGYKKYAKDLIEENEDKTKEKIIIRDANIDAIIQREKIDQTEGLIAGISYIIEKENDIQTGEIKNGKYVIDKVVNLEVKETVVEDVEVEEVVLPKEKDLNKNIEKKLYSGQKN